MGRKIPTQVRVRTDPDDGYAYRYDVIQDAKDVFDVGNNTEAIVAACEHAREDKEAKANALAYLACHADPEIMAGVIQRLCTRSMPIDVSVTFNEVDGEVQATADVQPAGMNPVLGVGHRRTSVAGRISQSNRTRAVTYFWPSRIGSMWRSANVRRARVIGQPPDQ